MPGNRWAVPSHGGSRLNGTRRISVEATGGLADQGQEQGKVNLLLLAVTGGQGVKIIGKIIYQGGCKVKFEAGGIIGLPDLVGQGFRGDFEMPAVFGAGGIDQQGQWRDGAG